MREDSSLSPRRPVKEKLLKEWEAFRFFSGNLVWSLSSSASCHCLDPLMFIQHKTSEMPTYHSSIKWWIYFSLDALYRFVFLNMI